MDINAVRAAALDRLFLEDYDSQQQLVMRGVVDVVLEEVSFALAQEAPVTITFEYDRQRNEWLDGWRAADGVQVIQAIKAVREIHKEYTGDTLTLKEAVDAVKDGKEYGPIPRIMAEEIEDRVAECGVRVKGL